MASDTPVVRSAGKTVAQLRAAIAHLPDDALVVVLDQNNDGTRTITEFVTARGYDRDDASARSLLIEISD